MEERVLVGSSLDLHVIEKLGEKSSAFPLQTA